MSTSSGYASDEGIYFTRYFMYKVGEPLGQGATANVFLGFHQHTGEQRALKIQKTSGFLRETEKEVCALASLDCENIVKFYDLDEDFQSGKTVLVMEYCNGGSLHSILQEPEYKSGLPDNKFQTLLSHLCKGLEVLHDKKILHRDIKPGNILLKIDSSGSWMFKLSDFGCSWQQENSRDDIEEVMSIAGTEEYLHPNLYKCAFVTNERRAKTGVRADLWSVGVTLYHAATGKVPIRPYGGNRNNRNAMFQMLSKKPPRKISGVQEKKNGRFLWSEHLPQDCNLSEGLKHIVEPLLAGLLESDPSKCWTYVTMFDYVRRIATYSVIFILYTCKAKLHTLYMPKAYNVSSLCERMAEITEQPCHKHVYLYNNNVLDLTDIKIADLPSTSRETPMLLFIDVDDDDEVHCADIYTDCRHTFNGHVNFNDDYKEGLAITSKLFSITKKIQDGNNSMHIMKHFEMSSREHMETTAIMREADCLLKSVDQDLFLFDVLITASSQKSLYRIHNLTKTKLQLQSAVAGVVEKQKILKTDFDNAPKPLLNVHTNKVSIENDGTVLDQTRNILQKMTLRRKRSSSSQLEFLQHVNDRYLMENHAECFYRQWNKFQQKLRESCNLFTKCIRVFLEYSKQVDILMSAMRITEDLRRQFHDDIVAFSVYAEKEKDDKLSIDHPIPSSSLEPVSSDVVNKFQERKLLLREKSIELDKIISDMDILM